MNYHRQEEFPAVGRTTEQLRLWVALRSIGGFGFIGILNGLNAV